MVQGSRWENVCAWRFFFFFLPFDPPFFLLSLSLSFPPFSLAFSSIFRMLGYLSHSWLVLTGLHYEGTMVNWTFFVKKFDQFFLTFFWPQGNNLIGRGPQDEAMYQISKIWAFCFQTSKFFKFFPIWVYVKQVKWPPAQGHFWPQCYNLITFGTGPLDEATYQISKTWAFWFQTRRFKFSVKIYF